MPSAKYIVWVDDNFHYQDETERYKLGAFDVYESAVREAKKIVDEFLSKALSSTITAEQLFSDYKQYGEDPWITPEPEGSHFSAWEYAEQQSKILCAKRDNK